MKKWIIAILAAMSGIAIFLFLRAGQPPEEAADPETRIIEYLRSNVRPGEPVIVTDLFNNVFTTREEQEVLQRLFNTFFKIPAAAVQLQANLGRIPTLAEISDQFAFRIPNQLDVLLRAMDADPRLPDFFERDADTGEITQIHVAAVAATPRFSQALQQATKTWAGEQAPAFSMEALSGEEVESSRLNGSPYVIYFWFTGCRPCMETAPVLAAVAGRYAAQGVQLVAANTDRVLGRDIDASEQQAESSSLVSPAITAHAGPEMHKAYAEPVVYPSLFFVNAEGRITSHLAGIQNEEKLDAAIRSSLSAP